MERRRYPRATAGVNARVPLGSPLTAVAAVPQSAAMPLELEPWNEGSAARVAAMVEGPGMQPEFDRLLGHGLAETMSDPLCPAPFRRLARLDGTDCGFAFAFVLPTSAGRPFASIRVGVVEGSRRRGVGAALHAALRAQLIAEVPDLAEIESGALVPNPAAEAFCLRQGLEPSRRYWMMQRPGRSVEAPRWPEGVALRVFENGDRDLAAFTDVFNRSWREQDHGVLVTVEDARELIANGSVDPAAIFLAEAAGGAVGFVRCARHATRGEVAVLGVVPEWRGRGLGRALLRWGTQWLLEHGAEPVTLLVDGKNDRALVLYRGEGFEVLRTRQIYSKKV